VASFYVENFGCRATQADGAAIEEQFREHGLDRAYDPRNADYVVLNTCAVTASAEQDARAAIRRVRRDNPGCKVIVTGCYAQRVPEEVASLPGVSVVVGNSHKSTLAQIALQAEPEKDRSSGNFVSLSSLTSGQETVGSIFVSDIFAHTELVAAPVFDSANERTRPNLKVQDGCNNRCSFCIIPSVRGHSRSLKPNEVLREVNQLVESGYREVVISGINLGRWGRDLQDETVWGGRPRPPKLEDLICTILDRTSLEKLRISSVEPMDWSESFIRLMANSPRIAKHAHVPMQSGSDAVLRRMHRKYRPWHYREKIEMIRAAMPSAAIGADVMVGFPGETESEFEETRRMIEELPFTYLHVFTFSARPGTPAAAATMPNQVPVQVARERNRILRELAAEKKRAFMQKVVGHKIEAITLNVISESEDGICTGALTDNYLKIRLLGRYKANQWLRADVTNIYGDTLIGNAIRRLATEVDDLSETGIARRQSHGFRREQTTRNPPAA
jgi:threonylcarbamoyladenosine tRNA methylthiotransferase MtaB